MGVCNQYRICNRLATSLASLFAYTKLEYILRNTGYFFFIRGSVSYIFVPVHFLHAFFQVKRINLPNLRCGTGCVFNKVSW